jgi:hypothetical protein
MQDSLSSDPPIATYAEFWPYYLREHSRSTTRSIHFFGTGMALSCLCAGLVTGALWFFPVALVAGYGPAWFAHYFVEKNRPATFSYPVWSLLSDFKMALCWIGGRLERELERAGVSDPAR